jgi:hypothetical protein
MIAKIILRKPKIEESSGVREEEPRKGGGTAVENDTPAESVV